MWPLTSGVANTECNKFLRSDYVDVDDDGDNENEQFLGFAMQSRCRRKRGCILYLFAFNIIFKGFIIF